MDISYDAPTKTLRYEAEPRAPHSPSPRLTLAEDTDVETLVIRGYPTMCTITDVRGLFPAWLSPRRIEFDGWFPRDTLESMALAFSTMDRLQTFVFLDVELPRGHHEDTRFKYFGMIASSCVDTVVFQGTRENIHDTFRDVWWPNVTRVIFRNSSQNPVSRMMG